MKLWSVAAGIAGLLILGALWAAYAHTHPRQSQNSIIVIRPYGFGKVWAFDDPAANLKREALIAGVPEILDELTKAMPHARDGFLLTFSASDFPTAQLKLTLVRPENGGAWYKTDSSGFPPLQGWLCPSLFKYFTTPPDHLWVRADADTAAPDAPASQANVATAANLLAFVQRQFSVTQNPRN